MGSNGSDAESYFLRYAFFIYSENKLLGGQKGKDTG